MAELVLQPLEPWAASDRKVVNTGLSLVGRGGNDYICGHCGKKIMTGMRLHSMDPGVIFKCGGCEGLNDRPEIDKMLAEALKQEPKPE